MTTAAACTVRTQYGSGGSSGNGSRTGRPVDPPAPRASAAASSPSCSSAPTSPFSHLSRHRGKSSAGRSRQGNAAGAGARKPPRQFKTRHEGKGPEEEGQDLGGGRQDGEEEGAEGKAGRSWSFSPAARRREREVTWPRGRVEGHESARRGRRLGSRWRAPRRPRRRREGSVARLARLAGAAAGPLGVPRLPVGPLSLSPPHCQPLPRPRVLCLPSNRFFSLVRLGEPRLDADRRRLVCASSPGKERGALEPRGVLPPRQMCRQARGPPFAYLAPGASVRSRGFCVCRRS